MRRMQRRGVAQRLWVFAGAALAVAALVSIPVIISWSRQARLDEVIATAESIRISELENRKAFGEYVAAEAAPRPPHAVDAAFVPWVPSEGFTRLNWFPRATELRGSFSVVLTPTGFVVHAACDIDGDGERALIEATEGVPARLVTPSGTW